MMINIALYLFSDGWHIGTMVFPWQGEREERGRPAGPEITALLYPRGDRVQRVLEGVNTEEETR
jgi:hypothetical protein